MLNLNINEYYEARVTKSPIERTNYWDINLTDKETKIELVRVYSIPIDTVVQLKDVLTICAEYAKETKKLLYEDLDWEYSAEDIYNEIEARAEVNRVS